MFIIAYTYIYFWEVKVAQRAIWHCWSKCLVFKIQENVDRILTYTRFHGSPDSKLLCQADQWVWALMILSDLLPDSLEADVISYNAGVAACEKGSQWQQGLWLLSEMQLASLLANLITYNAAITACANFLLWLQALSLLHQLEGRQLRGNVLTFAEVLRTCDATDLHADNLCPNLFELLAGRSQADLRGQCMSWGNPCNFVIVDKLCSSSSFVMLPYVLSLSLATCAENGCRLPHWRLCIGNTSCFWKTFDVKQVKRLKRDGICGPGIQCLCASLCCMFMLQNDDSEAATMWSVGVPWRETQLAVKQAASSRRGCHS